MIAVERPSLRCSMPMIASWPASRAAIFRKGETGLPFTSGGNSVDLARKMALAKAIPACHVRVGLGMAAHRVYEERYTPGRSRVTAVASAPPSPQSHLIVGGFDFSSL